MTCGGASGTCTAGGIDGGPANQDRPVQEGRLVCPQGFQIGEIFLATTGSLVLDKRIASELRDVVRIDEVGDGHAKRLEWSAETGESLKNPSSVFRIRPDPDVEIHSRSPKLRAIAYAQGPGARRLSQPPGSRPLPHSASHYAEKSWLYAVGT